MFPSFFIAGFEGSTGYNMHGRRIDSLARTAHDSRLHEDYSMIRKVGIAVARECIPWPLIDRRGRLDLSRIQSIVSAARRNGIVLIYDLFHFGYPHYLDPLTSEFRKRFADYCYHVAKFVARHTEGTCYFSPVNEPSYLAWAGGETGHFAPFLKGQGATLKTALVGAAIEGINAIWAACPDARIINVDPYCRVVPPSSDPEILRRCEEFNSTSVFEAWDMLAGLKTPELGGSRRHLDIVGVNYYWTNQWALGSPQPLPEPDPARLPLSDILRLIWERYRTDIVITETSHVDDRRLPWLYELGREVGALLSLKIPIGGLCWYPILEMPEWHSGEWSRLGLWDLDHEANKRRVPYSSGLRALRVLEEVLGSRRSMEQVQCA